MNSFFRDATEPSEEKADLQTATDWRSIAIILGLSFAIIFLRWTKIPSLVYGDPPQWLSQIARFARGELPYRDFSYNYPPLSILVLGWVARLFGTTFAVMQAAIDVLSLGIVLLSYAVTRYLLPRSLRCITIVAMTAVCATATTKFNLFSFSSYSPSLHVAAIGLLMVLWGGLRLLDKGRRGSSENTLLISGGFVAIASKPEAALAAVASLILLALLDRHQTFRDRPFRAWLGTYAGLLAAGTIPGFAVYAAVANVVGIQPFIDGVTGYGLASFACPWWPTGLGIFGAIAATGEGVFLAAIILWWFRSKLRPTYQPSAKLLFSVAPLGLLIFASYVGYLSLDFLDSGASSSVVFEEVVRSVFGASPILLPAMWISILLSVYMLFRISSLTTRGRIFLFFVSVPVVMSTRSLFGTTLFPFTEVSAMCYPFFALAAPYLMWELFRMLAPGPYAGRTITLLLGALSVLRLAAGYPSLFSDRSYYELATNAGRVYVNDGGASGEIYRYVLDHTLPDESILELPYGGGIMFAAGRPSAAFSTQYLQLRMPAQDEERDLSEVVAMRTKVVIALDQPQFGATWGYKANMNCTFPRLVWAPSEPSWDASHIYPLVRYIEQNYRVVKRFGAHVILIAN